MITKTIFAALLALVAISPMSAQRRSVPPRTAAATLLVLGTQGNAWNAASVGVSGTSNALDTQWAPFCSTFGNTSAAATITVQYSADNVNWYSTATNTGAVTG